MKVRKRFIYKNVKLNKKFSSCYFLPNLSALKKSSRKDIIRSISTEEAFITIYHACRFLYGQVKTVFQKNKLLSLNVNEQLEEKKKSNNTTEHLQKR